MSLRSLFPLLWALLLAGLSACHRDSSDPAPAKVPSYVVSTLAGQVPGRADGVGLAAQFSEPSAAALDVQGTLYTADTDNNRIRTVSPRGIVGTLASTGARGSADGHGYEAQFDRAVGIAADAHGAVYVTDWGTNRVRVITPQ